MYCVKRKEIKYFLSIKGKNFYTFSYSLVWFYNTVFHWLSATLENRESVDW